MPFWKWLKFNNEKLTLSITCDQEAGDPSKLHISNTLVINNHPQNQHQSNIVKALKRFFWSIDMLELNNATIRLAQAPTCEAIAKNFQAMNNTPISNPMIMDKHFTRAMQEWEERLGGKFATMVSVINLNTDRHVESSIDKIMAQANIFKKYLARWHTWSKYQTNACKA